MKPGLGAWPTLDSRAFYTRQARLWATGPASLLLRVAPERRWLSRAPPLPSVDGGQTQQEMFHIEEPRSSVTARLWGLHSGPRVMRLRLQSAITPLSKPNPCCNENQTPTPT